jgi:ABC-type Fe3+ transport system permease subunit
MATLTSSLILLPLGVSSITLAYGLLRAVAVPLGWNLNPWPIIVIAQTIIGLPFTTRAIEVSLSHVDSDYLDQADLLGASRFERLFFVEMPLIAPGIVVGGIFAFAMAIGEMSATLFVALPQNVTLAVAIYQYLAVTKFVQAGAASLVIAFACFAAFLVMEKLMRGASRGVLGWSE